MGWPKDHRYRQAVEDRIRNQASRKGIAPNVLRRRFALEVLAAGLCYASPDRWMLKGGFALRTRLGDPARHSMDLDAEHRGGADAAMGDLQKLAAGPVAVPFRFELVGVEEVPEHGVARAVRARLNAVLAGRLFEELHVDVSVAPPPEWDGEPFILRPSVQVPGFPESCVLLIPVERQIAEKLVG